MMVEEGAVPLLVNMMQVGCLQLAVVCNLQLFAASSKHGLESGRLGAAARKAEQGLHELVASCVKWTGCGQHAIAA